MKFFQSFQNRSKTSVQNRYKPCFMYDCIMLYHVLLKKWKKLSCLQKCLIFDVRFLETLEMETKSETCILLSNIFLINPNWHILSPSPNKKVSYQVAFFYKAIFFSPCPLNLTTVQRKSSTRVSGGRADFHLFFAQ